MLQVALCVYPNLFSFLSSDPYEALCRMAAICACLLGAETILLRVRIGWSSIAWLSLAAAVAAAILAALAGRQATIGLACAGAPSANQAANQTAEASTNTLAVLQAFVIAACLMTITLLVVGVWHLWLARRPSSQPT